MLNETMNEALRQTLICNSCRYCEGYCSVFPAMHSARHFASGDLTQFANLCHNCQNCYDACQYADPHEFNINIPAAFARVRQESWEDTAFPKPVAKAFARNGSLIVIALVGAISFFLWLCGKSIGDGEGFYGVLSHNVMIAAFLPAFLFSILAIGIGVMRYWNTVGGGAIKASDILSAFSSAGRMKNLSGGHGDGCTFEDEGNGFSHLRRWFHQATMYGFLLCFASTSVATILHYAFNQPAPYDLLSLPKLFGVSGGLLLVIGTLGMLWMKVRGREELQDTRVRGGEFGFILLLFLVSSTGLALYALGSTPQMPEILALHLGSVLTFFLLMPYSKMAHGFYRLAALVRDAAMKRQR